MNILLTNSKFIKSISNISDNVSDKYLLPAIREAQDINLMSLIGEKLLDKIKELIYTSQINASGNTVYKTLLNKSQYFLAYQTLSNLCVILSYKLDNVGLSRTSDENIAYASEKEVLDQSDYYLHKADFYALEIQNYMLNNRASLPELNNEMCNSIRANLFSVNSCGMVLGGARGKRGYKGITLNYIGK